MPSKRFQVEKLIRDHLPTLLRAKGISLSEKALDPTEFLSKLKEKLLEEAQELTTASNAEELLEELADLVEVTQAIAKEAGVTMQQIEEKRIEKRRAKGGFDTKTYVRFVDIEENNPAISYYLSNPQYREIKPSVHRPDCLFCKIARQEKPVSFIKKFTHCYVIKDEYPVSQGHLLLIANTHTENWFTAPEEVRDDIIKALHLMKEQLDADYQPDGYNIGANCGEVAGQTIMHLHVHLIPRYKGDMENPRGGVRGVIPSKQKY